MLTFNIRYFLLMILFLVIEILIALYVTDDFIRPYLGDTLVVILIYCFVKSFVKISGPAAVVAVLIFAFTIEFLQMINFIEMVQLQHSKLARTVIGTSYSIYDIIAYIAGGVIIIIAEKISRKKLRETAL